MPLRNKYLRVVLFPLALFFSTILRKNNTTIDEQLQIFDNTIDSRKITDETIAELENLGFICQSIISNRDDHTRSSSRVLSFSKEFYKKNRLFPVWLYIKMIVSIDGSIESLEYESQQLSL